MESALRNKRILVTGARGMLASDLVPLLDSAGATLELVDLLPGEHHGRKIDSLDITQKSAVAGAVSKFSPDWIVNCAAFTAVDDAEVKQAAAYAVNGDAVGILAQAAKECGGRMLHISTDYVFGAVTERRPCREEDAVSPQSVYGKSKLRGEELLREILPDRHLLVRTSWLHGVHGPNFLATMLRVGAERKALRVVNDQFGSPTYAAWLAEVLTKLVARDARGIFHASSRGDITWFDFASEIFEQAGMAVTVSPQTTAELNRPAPRPPYSTLDVTKLEAFLGEPSIGWKECIHRHLQALHQ